MKTLIATAFTVALACASSTLAAHTAPATPVSPLTFLFLAFGAMILVFQFVPAIALFVSMVIGLLSPNRDEAAAPTEAAPRG